MNLQKNIKKIARAVLINEAQAIENLTQFIDDDFERCVQEIYSAKGRVVITGVGKSAIIANKIVATLNSTGTPSIFMHAADAIHGDLGMVQKEDIVICISKSGNTSEIKVLVPLLKRRGVKLVALVSNTNSYLSEQADFVLNATIAEEACPHNLAPTTSTTAHVAMGDALAVCLLELRNFSSSDFAEFHPGGSLGKQLYLKVSDIYVHHQLPEVSPDAPLRDVILEISSKRLGCTSVLDGNKILLGIITDGDLRRMLQKGEDLNKIRASEIMTTNPKSIQKDEYAVKALQVMQQNNITQLVVMDGNKVAGFIHLHDLLKEGII
ncbi:KpsF/GutQ family sugar-phosphate isomerase [Chryseosolibacter indicus]|uniref:KpsF/GutQ family sugar-phosphate isomerase n=1 Tax=Chryseosolibacter indicus TaxID=2782351 RepID=A0ABS5VKK1_9BACT|nr:KpsF/GutQ family sugar-phosphate isomerase [Chryseosolibacter indicus]MBT1701968.1 KpsF/GutQ family sugar-phosphate isomerase [Chryseosolibacter indicus]